MVVYAAFFEVGVLHELGVEGDGGFDWADLELVEGAECSGDRGFSGLGVDDELVLSELIDSMSAIRLVAYLEADFGVVVPPSEITIENFTNVTAISAFVRDLQQRSD